MMSIPRVLLDISPIYATWGGHRTYALELNAEMSARKDVAIRTFTYRRSQYGLLNNNRVLNACIRDLLIYGLLSPLRGGNVDIVHSTGLPVFAGPTFTRHIITVHDMAPLDTPWRYSVWNRLYFKTIFRYACRRASAIICISEFTRLRLKHYWPSVAANAYVVPQGSRSCKPTFSAKVSELPREFLLFVGNLDKGKNLKLVLDCYSRARMLGQSLPPLVVVGGSRIGYGDSVDRSNLIWLQALSDGELAFVYANAKALLFPSLYEGFGLPLVEAMSFGVPVITIPCGSIPEVGGDAVLMSSPTADAYLSDIQLLLNNRLLYAELQERGRLRSTQFTWEKTAEQTAQVYREVLCRSRRDK